jgi:predicted acyltransferase
VPHAAQHLEEASDMSTTVSELDAAPVEKQHGANGGGPTIAPPSTRMLSLDVFRGLTIAGMILVNNPGTWGAIYSPLEHAEWNGWTPTDLIFPSFLFIVGVSITLALGRRVESGGSQRDLYTKIVRRTLIIIGLGLFLHGFPYFHLATLRIPGVLQRIAVCYFFAAIIFLKTRWRTQAVIAAALLIVYWMLMKLVAAPGSAAGDLSMEGSLASYVDRTVFGRHTWKPLYDPEGLLSTIPSIATTLCGVLTGHLLRSRRTPIEKVAAMFVAGAACIIVGWVWNYWFPINKALWTSSFAVFTAGMALQLLALCYWLVDIKGYKRWALPFVVFGVNAIAVYFITDMIAILSGLITFTGANGKEESLHGLVFQNLFASWASPVNASLAFAVCFVLLALGLMTILYRRGTIIKV